MRFDSLSIFLIVLIVFVILVLLMNWVTCSKETFVTFNSDIITGNNIGKVIYVPQYSSPNTNTVITLYDSIYFDFQNGTLIEVFAPNATGKPKDVTGSTITEIAVSPRDGSEIINYRYTSPTAGYSTPQSLVTSITPTYNQYQYTTMNTNTTKYQVFYISWHKNTYLHLVDLESTNSENGNKCGSNLYTYSLNNNGLTNVVSGNNLPKLPDYSSVKNIVTLSNSSYKTIKYLSSANLYQIATSSPPSGTSSSSPASTSSPQSNKINISYDISYGNIVIDGDEIATPIVYNRAGNGTPSTTLPNSYSYTKIQSPNTFIIKDMYPYAAILVIADKYDTIISVITPSLNNYTLLTSVRFNRKQMVTNTASDTDNNNNDEWKGWDQSDWKKRYSRRKRRNNRFDDDDESKISEICGDDQSCKWYWHFNHIGKNSGNNGMNILSDDYFLKTEVVPPVCPQCPMCPDSGICSNCGGTGGSGSCNSKTGSNLTPSPTVPGTFTDASGVVFILYTDSKGNKSYVPLSSITNRNTAAAGSNSTTSKNATIVDANGQFVTTSDPDTFGGGLAVSTMSFNQLGTSAFNNTRSFANNVVDTAGGLAGGALGLAGNALENVTDLAKGAGSGIMQIGSSNGQRGSNGQPGSNTGGVSNTGTYGATSDKTFGNIPGKTPVDNYSYYGALQTKGSDYMPVTADFSSFRK